MIQNTQIPTLDALKRQARNLRDNLGADGQSISHSKSLEILARQYGFRDWNTLHSASGNRPPQPILTVGRRVSGFYLGQAFKGEVLAVQTHPSTGRTRVTFDFDDAVDVVSFDSFSAMRKRVSCFLNAQGRTIEKTSNGQPQMALNL